MAVEIKRKDMSAGDLRAASAQTKDVTCAPSSLQLCAESLGTVPFHAATLPVFGARKCASCDERNAPDVPRNDKMHPQGCLFSLKSTT